MAGRPLKPIALHMIQGTGRTERLARRANELSLAPGQLDDPPDFLDADALAEWQRITKHAEYSKVLAGVHWGALVDYCILFSRMLRDAREQADKTIPPEARFVMKGTERQTLQSLRMQLGITPASQSKVKMPEKPVEENKWAALKSS